MRRHGQECLLTREPGGTVIGEEIRKLLQQASEITRMSAEAELLLFAASRAQLVIEVLKPTLAKGGHIIADRFLDSTTIYQGVARGLDPQAVATINEFAVQGCRPDITFLLDLDPVMARERMAARTEEPSDRIERLPLTFFEQVREGYRQLAAAEPGRFVMLDGAQKVSALAEQIWDTLTSRFDGVFS